METALHWGKVFIVRKRENIQRHLVESRAEERTKKQTAHGRGFCQRRENKNSGEELVYNIRRMHSFKEESPWTGAVWEFGVEEEVRMVTVLVWALRCTTSTYARDLRSLWTSNGFGKHQRCMSLGSQMPHPPEKR